MSRQPELQKVAFVDTNVLHFLDLYLQFAKSEGLYPWCPDGTLDDATEAVKLFESDEPHKEALRRGLAVVSRLLSEQIDVQYSAVSELELINTRAEGLARTRAAGSGVPRRMWSRFREEEIQKRVNSSELVQIRGGVEELMDMLRGVGVTVFQQQSRAAGEALELGKSIGGLVYLDVVDSIVYAGALVAQADHLLTSDYFLNKTANRIRTPGCEEWKGVRDAVRRALANEILTPKEVILPVAHTITPAGKFKPAL